MSDLHRGIVLNMYRLINGLSIRELAERMEVSTSNIAQIQAKMKRGGPDFWKRFEEISGISCLEIDRYIVRHFNHDNNEILKRIIKS